MKKHLLFLSLYLFIPFLLTAQTIDLIKAKYISMTIASPAGGKWIWNQNINIGDTIVSSLTGSPNDYDVPWCSGFGCCNSSSYNGMSIARHTIQQNKRYRINVTGGLKGGSYFTDGFILIPDNWKIDSITGSPGDVGSGAYYTKLKNRIFFHSGTNYGGCSCSDCGRANLNIYISSLMIFYNPLVDTTSVNSRYLQNVRIVSQSGVNITGFKPRIYYKKSSNSNTYIDNTNLSDGWKWTEYFSKSGDYFTFFLDYNKLFGAPIITNTGIDYFIVAQDTLNVPNVINYKGTLAGIPSSVNLGAVNFPVTGNYLTYTIHFPQNINIWNFISVAESGLGRAIRMNVDNGVVVGTYQTSPSTSGDPSRTTVDFDGNVWVGNRAEGSVCRLGLVLGGTRCNSDFTDNPTGDYLKPPFSYPLNALSKYDKNGDGLIKTSLGMKSGSQHVLAWENNAPTDELIMYISGLNSYCPNLTHVRHVSVDSSNNIWVGAHTSSEGFVRLNGQTGQVMESYCNNCGGYGGLVDRRQVLWSSDRDPFGLLMYNTVTHTQQCLSAYGSYGLTIDTRGNVWNANWEQGRVRKFRPSGTLAGDYSIGRAARGLAVTPTDNHIWIANSNDNGVTRIDSLGNIIKFIGVGAHPTGVAVDYNGKIWITNLNGNSLSRINPNISNGVVDTTINLPSGASPYNYSDMTGTTLRSVYPERFRTIPLIYGPTTVINYQNTTYTTSQKAGTTLLWKVNGGTINGSVTNDTITITWGSCGTGWVRLVQTLVALGVKDSVTNAVSIMLPYPGHAEPLNNATQVVTNPVLKWHSDTLATSYRLQLAGNSTFTTIIKDTTGITDTSWTAPMLTFSQIYYWRLKSSNQTCSSSWTSPWAFTTMPAPVNLPPTINSIPDPPAISEDAPQQTVLFAGVVDGNPHPLQVQNLTVTASSSNPAKIPNPTITYTPNNASGYVRYTPVANANGNVQITITVTDDGGTANGGINTTSVTFNVIITPVNDAPIANAGSDQVITAGQSVQLNGTASADVDGDILQYRWIAPPGLQLSDTTNVSPSCVIPFSFVTQNYTFRLRVFDGLLYSPYDEVVVTAIPPPPHIIVVPLQLSDTLFQNQTSDLQLFIQNTGIGNLTYSLSENASWMSLWPVSGNVAPAGSTVIGVNLNPGTMAGGVYTSNLNISSNDPGSPLIQIPVTLRLLTPLTVTATAQPQAVCQGTPVQLNATAIGGYGNYSYSWSSNPAGFNSTLQNPVVVPSTTTTYTVTISDGHSSANNSVQVIRFENNPPAAVSNMLPADLSYHLQLPIQFSWAPSVNASQYDIYIWKYNTARPTNPVSANLSQITYTLNAGAGFTYGDTCKWQIVAKNPCFQSEGPVQTFSIRGLPDLHITNVTTSQPLAGLPVTISWTVRNDGNAATMPGTVWLDRVWLTPDIEVRIGEPEDILLGQFTNVTALQPGQSYVQTVQITMPANLIGNYFLFVISDDIDALFINWPPAGPPLPYTPPPFIQGWSHYGSTVQEYVEHDNFFYKEMLFPIPPLPDLQVTSIISPPNVFSGEIKNITWTVKNKGNGNTNTSTWIDQIYLTPDTLLNTATAINLGSLTHNGVLNPDSSYTASKMVTIPDNIYGTYYFFILTDFGNTVFEYVYEENNEKRSDPVTIFLTPPADLIVTTVGRPDTISNTDEFTIQWSVKNQGSTAPIVNQWQDGIYLTANSLYDLTGAISLGTKERSGTLLPDNTYQTSKIVTLSSDISGPFYVYVKTDVTNTVYEFNNENNNLLRSTTPLIVINPDLMVESVSIPALNSNSAAFNVEYVIRNNGPGKILNKTWKDRIYASKAPVFNSGSAIVIGETTHTGVTLLKNQTIAQVKSVLLPDSLSGIIYLFVQTDFSNSIFENVMENNNMGRSTSGMEVRKPDIVAGSLSVPMIDSTNTPVTVLWSVTNTGTGSVQNRTWIDKIFVSYDSLFNPVTAIPMGSLSYTTSLSPGASISKELTVTIPDSLPGPYYMFVFADATNLIYENLSEANNIARSSSQVQVLRPDLIVTGIDAQDTVLSGSIIPVQWTTKNNGPVSIINQTWKDRLYLTQQPVLVTSNALLLAEKTNTGTLHSGQTATRESEVIIPDGIQGNYYLFVYTDYSDLIPENVHEDNNVAKSGLRINPGPWADLHGVSIVVTDTALAGSTIPLLFTVVNAGDKKIQNKSWKDKVFISSSPAWNPTGATLLREFIHNEAVDTNATYQTNTAIALPSGFTNGNYYCYIYTDAENSVYENIHENNNIFRSSLLYINALPPVDLAVTTVAHIDSAGSGQPIVIDWTIKNSGNSSTVTSWYDGIYLSSDTLFNSATDIFLGKKMHFGIISPGVTYNTSHQVYLPNGSSGLHYLFVVADHDRVNNDQNFTNNARCKHSGANNPVPVRIILTPPPDLVLSSLSSPSQVFTGQPFTVNWTSVNSGPGATIPGNWTDKLYLSTDLTLNAGDIHVGAKTHTGTLTSGQDYTENLEITFPATISGNYILLAKTDHDNAVYEVNESNNTRYTFIVVSHPPPADLIVTNVQAPPSIFAGKEATITWNIKNAGANPASGSVKDMIYFSSDTLWDIHDILFGTFQSGINLPGNGQISRSVTAKANDIGIGQYFTIVKTDVLNSVYETNELNNHGYPNYPSMADVTILPLDMVKHDTMVDHENLYYRIPIGDSLNNSTLLTTLKADSIYGMNEIYQRHNAMPTRITYDFTGGNPYMGNQEVLIPSISEGNYYTLLYGNTMNGNRQHFSILAEILNFEIISVSPNSAGNDGSVTVLIRGSNFNPGMRFKLYGTDQIVSDSILFVDRSRIYATFNLQGASPGIYDMIADNYCMNHDTLFQSFEITNSIKPELGLATITPPNVRANRITSFTIEYTNLGNTNLIDPVIVVKSEGGAPIGLAVEDLVNNQQQLTLHLKEDNGPPGILRPGYLGTIVIYTRSTGPLGFTILIQN